MRRVVLVLALLASALVVVPAAGAKVLLVGTYHGVHGKYSSLQAAVDAAHPGDWILLAPGDYKTTSSQHPRGRADEAAGVLVTKPDIWIVGMNRNSVIVDGTKSGPACSTKAADQNFGPKVKGKAQGLNGIMVFKAKNVDIENLTVCNFLGGAGDAGNEIWWNGANGSGKIGGHGMWGSYLTATSRFYNGETTAAQYGIFSSNWDGGEWIHTYTSNFNDSGYYIGACQDECNQTIDDAWAQYNALGYSGTNSGGSLLVENSQFDHNEEGFDTNSQNNDDWPSPQNGACPAGVGPPVAGAPSCWVFYKNYVHDNNNPDVPSAGAAAAGPVGTGMTISGGRDDTIMDNRFVNNGAWGAAFVPYPDLETPPKDAIPCEGGTPNFQITLFGLPVIIPCYYEDSNDAMIGNTFTHDGFYGNPTNGDIAELTLIGGPSDCFASNVDTHGNLTSSPAGLQQSKPTCGGQVAGNNNTAFLAESACDTQILGPGTGCQPGDKYPRRKKVVMHALPKHLQTMPNVCGHVPANPWCPAHKGKAYE
ncbi:MAG TPA: hypothetical protein VME22_00995 [Solirubrobacteraceae bacterium]|nr:hypothetical protein [Solirubrobacteraceae bacterium]